MRPEPRGGQEGWGSLTSRWKVGLETPLEGRFWRETRLTFAPPTWYDVLTWACMGFGAAWFLAVYFPIFRWFLPFNVHPSVLIWLGPVVFVAGLWGQLSNERMTIDLKSGTYVRREGQGLFKKVTKGRVADLDAIVALTEVYPVPDISNQHVIYRLVLHWKGHREPPLVIGRTQASIKTSQPLNYFAGSVLQNGARFAERLGIGFYDNTYFSSPAPQRPV